MKFMETVIPGVMIVGLEPKIDARGYFARAHCAKEFAASGNPFSVAQTSLSRNFAAGTLRGMHYQRPPRGESKLVRVVRGSVYDVALDLRPDSPTYLRWTAAELSGQNGLAVLIPAGVAHGFLTLEADTDILYQIDRAHDPSVDLAVRWNDPLFSIKWPGEPDVIAPSDASLPDFTPKR